jgi:hypothetical protein
MAADRKPGHRRTMKKVTMPATPDLTGERAVVTGGSSGLGPVGGRHDQPA